MIPQEIIRKKRNGEKLNKEEIEFMVLGYVKGEIPDYQMSAFLMAIFFQGMNKEETVILTETMMRSGVVFDLRDVEGYKMDKHSTGGVGDKVSLIWAPLVASYGYIVPMVSGRGLGHTGGTLDKLESIKGFDVNLSYEEFKKVLKDIGLCMIGQTKEFNPADKKMYALRDVTGTVESIPLIASSIMSKKMGEGINGLILDVKWGNGAFMNNYDDAKKLARTMVEIGKGMGRDVKAYLTSMEEILGYTAGNALEVKESIEILRGELKNDTYEVTIELAVELISMVERGNKDKVRNKLEELIDNGKAYEKFIEMVKVQKGDISMVEDISKLPISKNVYEYKAKEDGTISRLYARNVGIAVLVLGGGRKKKEDDIDHSVGVEVLKKGGDKVSRGDVIFKIYYNDEDKLKESINYLDKSYEIGTPYKYDLLSEVIE